MIGEMENFQFLYLFSKKLKKILILKSQVILLLKKDGNRLGNLI